MDPTLDTVSPTTPATQPADDTEFRLDPRLPNRWTTLTLLLVLPIGITGIVVVLLFDLWWAALAIALLASLLPWWTHYYGRRYTATSRCVLGDAGLFVERGVWWRSQTFVPRQRVQHIDVDQGPLARRFGLATLKVFTAGSVHSEIQVEDLRHADALQLRDDLLERPLLERHERQRP